MSEPDYSVVSSSANNINNIPAFLRRMPRWLSWSLTPGPRSSKKPDQSTAAPGRKFSAIQGNPGLIVTGGLPMTTADGATAWIVPLDLDACRDPATGWLAPEAVEIVRAFGNTLSEVTPSGYGIRVFAAVRRLPEKPLGRTKVTPEWRAPEGCAKRPELQLFGLGPALYVTVTGDRIMATGPDIVVVDSLDWLIDRYDLGHRDPLLELPAGEGTPPDIKVLQAAVAEDDRLTRLAAGTWKDFGSYRSASDAFYALHTTLLRAARGHANVVIDYLLGHTAWGKGLVHDSMDPGKYTRREWIQGDMLRAAEKGHVAPIPATQVFEDLGEPEPAPAKPEHRWRLQELDDLLATPAPPWLIRDYIRAGQVGFLFAFPTAGKSTLAAAWAMCVLHGRPWAGHAVRAGNVLCLIGEGRRGFAHRLAAARKHFGLGPIPKGRRLVIADFRVPLSSPEGHRAIMDLVKAETEAHGPPALIIIDTLSAHWAASEDSSEFAAPAMRVLGEVAAVSGAAIGIVHHTTKAKGRSVMPAMEDLRGSGAFLGNSDFVIGMSADAWGAHVLPLKMKDDEKPGQLRLPRVSVEVGHDEDGEALTAAVLDDTAAEAIAGEAQREDESLEADMRAVVEALRGLGGAATTRDAIAQAARLRLQRGRACVDLGVAKGYLAIRRATAESPRGYTVTPAGIAWVNVFAADEMLG